MGTRVQNPLASWMWKQGPHSAYILVFIIILVFNRLLFFAFFGAFFWPIRVFVIAIASGFTIISQLFSVCCPVCPNGDQCAPSAKFSPLAQTSGYAIACCNTHQSIPPLCLKQRRQGRTRPHSIQTVLKPLWIRNNHKFMNLKPFTKPCSCVMQSSVVLIWQLQTSSIWCVRLFV